MNSENGFFADTLNSIKPRPRCPLMPGKYGVDGPIYVDLSVISSMPFEGYRWVITVKGFSGEKKKKLVLCFRIDGVVSEFRRRGK